MVVRLATMARVGMESVGLVLRSRCTPASWWGGGPGGHLHARQHLVHGLGHGHHLVQGLQVRLHHRLPHLAAVQGEVLKELLLIAHNFLGLLNCAPG